MIVRADLIIAGVDPFAGDSRMIVDVDPLISGVDPVAGVNPMIAVAPFTNMD